MGLHGDFLFGEDDNRIGCWRTGMGMEKNVLLTRRNLGFPPSVHEERNNENENRKTDWPRKTGIFDCTRDSTPAARLVPPNNYLVGVPWPCRQTTNIIPPDKNSALRPEDQHPQKTIPTFSPPSKPIGQNPCIRKANRGRAQA